MKSNLAIAATLALGFQAIATAGDVDLISVSSTGVQGDMNADLMTFSADMKWVAFSSLATNLVPGDTNNANDIFLRDQTTGQVIRISVTSGGVEAEKNSVCPVISDDGNVVVYASWANNLVSNDGGFQDVFLYDRNLATTELISVATSPTGGDEISGLPTVSADGRFVAFYSSAKNLIVGDTNNQDDLFVRDRQTGTTSRITMGMGGQQTNSSSVLPNITADGRYVAYTSIASNIVPGDTNDTWDIFRFDRQTGVTALVSTSINGGGVANGWSNAGGIGVISADGNLVTFTSIADDLVPGDTNLSWDIFVHDMTTGVNRRVSVDSNGGQSNNDSFWSVISRDGRFVAYESVASNLIPGDSNQASDIFVHDLKTGKTVLMSENLMGTVGDSSSYAPAISADGSEVGFFSLASDLVAADTNSKADLFINKRCWVSGEQIGTGLAGTGGLVPSLEVKTGPCYAGGFEVALSDAVGGSVAFLFAAPGIQTGLPVLGGTFYLSGTLVSAPLPLGGTSGLAGDGGFVIQMIDLEAYVGLIAFTQALIADNGAPFGVSFTNAAQIAVDY